MFPLRLEQPSDRKDRQVLAKLRMFLLSHPTKETLNDRRVVGTSNFTKLLRKTWRNSLQPRERSECPRCTVPDASRQVLPASYPADPPVEVISAKTLITTVA